MWPMPAERPAGPSRPFWRTGLSPLLTLPRWHTGSHTHSAPPHRALRVSPSALLRLRARRVSQVAHDFEAAKRAAQHLHDTSRKLHEVLIIAGAGPVGCYCALQRRPTRTVHHPLSCTAPRCTAPTPCTPCICVCVAQATPSVTACYCTVTVAQARSLCSPASATPAASCRRCVLRGTTYCLR